MRVRFKKSLAKQISSSRYRTKQSVWKKNWSCGSFIYLISIHSNSTCQCLCRQTVSLKFYVTSSAGLLRRAIFSMWWFPWQLSISDLEGTANTVLSTAMSRYSCHENLTTNRPRKPVVGWVQVWGNTLYESSSSAYKKILVKNACKCQNAPDLWTAASSLGIDSQHLDLL